MSKKRLTAMVFLALMLACPVLAQRGAGLIYHEVQVVDEFGRKVTDITSVHIYLPGTTTTQTIYTDSSLALPITLPMTTTSTNTTLSNGSFYWYGQDLWDFRVSDGTNVHMNTGHNSLPASIGRIVFPSYLQSISSTTYSDAQTATFGSDGDFILNGGETTNLFTVTPAATDESAAWWFGADATGIDVFFYAAMTGDYIQWDASDEQLEAVGASILIDDGKLALGDGDAILLGDTLGTGDFSISDISDVLTIDVVVAGVGSIAIGNDADDVPLVWYGETTGAEVTFTGDDIQVDGMSLCMGNGDAIQFGDALGTGQMYLSISTAALTVGQIAAGTGTLLIGVNDAGIDTTFYGDTNAEYLKWDTSEDTLTGNLGNVLFTTVDAEANQFKVDATGTVAGNAIVLETTLGGIQLLADGATQGDITIDAQDTITIVSTDADADGILINANGGASESINIYSAQGTAASATTEHDAAIQLHAAAGGIGLYSAGNVANAVRIEANGGGNETITLQAIQGTGTSSILLDSTLGGVKIASHAAGKDIDIDSVLGSIHIEAEEDDATAILITADGGTSTGLKIHNDTGTGDESILIASDVGGITVNAAAGSIDIEAVGATDGDIGINAGDDMTITAGGDLALDMSVGVGTFKGSWLPDSMLKKTITTGSLSSADCGYVLQVSADAQTITLPSTATGLEFTIMNIAADGGALITVTPAAVDKFIGAGLTGAADQESLLNTKATADKGDYIRIVAHTDGWVVAEMNGTWAEATP